MCNVSTVTVSRAMKVLRDEGSVEGFWGKGYFPPGMLHKKTNDSVIVRIPKHQFIYDKIAADIFNGRFKLNHSLPGMNQLCALYEVSRPTMCKVLELLISEKIIRKIGVKHYLYNTTIKTRLKIALIAFGLSSNEIKITSERERNFYRNISNTAIQQNVDLHIICYNDYLDTPQFYIPGGHDLYTFFKQTDICGSILSTWHMNNSAQCLRTIISFGKPVSICVEDQHVLELMAKYSANSKGITFFDASYSTIPGKDVGVYLQGKGHREIAYLSPFHKSTWSQNRLAGLMEIYGKPGDFTKVYPFVLDEFVRDYAFMEKIIENPSFEKDVAVERITNRIPPFMKNRISSINMEYDILLRDALIFSYCEPLIRKAVSVSSITAWVCANDLIACMIMDYWNYHAIAVDKRPALIGFDNSFESFERGVSTYEFNTGGETQSMLNNLLYPNSSLLQKSKRIVRLNGSVIERASSLREPELR
jgi:DNA-binding transcriptional regulator YhcF (GntR family)